MVDSYCTWYWWVTGVDFQERDPVFRTDVFVLQESTAQMPKMS